MWLSQWIGCQGWTASKLANQLSVSGASTSRLLSGEQMPGRTLRRRIFELTEGRVTANDLAAAHDAWHQLPPVETLLRPRRPVPIPPSHPVRPAASCEAEPAR